ncbi:MAG: SpoIIE family protein phosphatase [Actinomycetota bacterium]
MQPPSQQPSERTAAVLSRLDGRILVDALSDAVVVTDSTWRIRHINPAAERLLGWRDGDLVGQPLTSIIPEQLDEAVIGHPVRLAALRRDGAAAEVDLVVSVFGLEDRRIFVAALRDISDRIELERERRSATYLQATTEVAVRLALAHVTGLDDVAPIVLAALADVLGWEAGAVWSPEEADRAGELASHVLATGEAAWTASSFAFPILGAAGTLAVVELHHRDASPPDGDLLSAMTTIGNHVGRIVEAARMQREVQNRVAFLARATSLLEASLDHHATLARLADLAVPYLADACIIELSRDDELVRAAAASRRRRLERTLRSPVHAAEALRTGAPQAYSPGEGLSAAVAVPLVARGDRFGVMSLGLETPKAPFSEAQLTLAVDLAQRAALAVDGARRFGEQSYVAAKLQDALLPRALPDIPGVELGVRYVAAGSGVDVGGDFYDVFATGDGAWALVVGDVVGKGVEAAAVTGVARYTLRALALHDRRPSALLDGLNRALRQEEAEERYCTACYVRLEPLEHGHDAVVGLAGHPEPIVLRADGRTETVGRPGTLLGAFEHVRLEDEHVQLEPGDALVLFTDGVTERHRDDDFFGADGLAALLAGLAGATADEIAGAVEQAVVDFDAAASRDDLAVLVARVAPTERGG